MWTKSQKISGGVLAVAVVAFAVDHFVLHPSGTETPTASEYAVGASSGSGSSTEPATAKTAKPASPSQATTLASRLSALAVARRYQYVATADAFRPTDLWLAQGLPAPDPAAAKAAAGSGSPTAMLPAEHKSDPASEFASHHAISAVMNNRSGGMAIVDGKLYEPGQMIDGFKLVKVGTADATFAAKGATVTLRLPGQLPLADIR